MIFKIIKASTLAVIILLPLFASAQSTLSGCITDTTGTPLDGAMLAISKDGKMIGQQFADQGKFHITNLTGRYEITAQLVGYEIIKRTFNAPLDSLILVMRSISTHLKLVIIAGRQPIIQHKADRTTFNVQNSILAGGGNVWDALSKAPGVQTTTDGQVTANNKGVTIYIDDKPVRLSGENLAAYLSGLPAANISKIDIITNPSARYDAQGGLVINIVTKKNLADGFNGAVSGGYTQGNLGSFNTSTVLNYRKYKINIYGNYGYSEKRLKRMIDAYAVYQTPTNYSDWESKRIIDPLNMVSSYQFGADFNISKGQIIGVLINGNNGTRSSKAEILTSVYNDHSSVADSLLNTNDRMNGHTDQYSFNLNYKVKLDTAGRGLNLDVDYVPYRYNSDQFVKALTIYAADNLSNTFNVYTPTSQHIDIWSVKLDHIYKLGKIWDVESGLKYTGINSGNKFDFYDAGTKSQVRDPGRSSNFEYGEKTAAAYTSAEATLGKWSIVAGLRAEYTITLGNSISLDSSNNNKYLKIFPTLSLSYKLSGDHVFAANYNQRVDRPSYSSLNPARTYSTPYSFQQGNPSLQPYITTNASLAYTFKENYTLAIAYTGRRGLISNVTVQDNLSKTMYDTQQNLDNIEDYTIQFQAHIEPVAWWEINLDVNGNYRQQRSQYLDGFFSSHNFGTDITASQSFELKKRSDIKAELRAYYRTAINQGLLYIDRTNDISVGLSKAIMKKQVSVKLAFNDILYGNPYRLSTSYLSQHNGSYQRNDTRNVTVSFSYRFGKSITAARKRSTASDEEKMRTN